MRLAYKYILADSDEKPRQDVDQTPAEFAEAMCYPDISGKLTSKQDFYTQFEAPWMNELHDVLRTLLDPTRKTLGLGSGFGEHELKFALKGYDITASDIVTDQLLVTQALFSELKTRRIDVFDPPKTEKWDDILITGLDFYFSDSKARLLFDRIAEMLKESRSHTKRLILVIRYRDNLATLLIDKALGGRAILLNAVLRIRREQMRWLPKAHGFRRSERDIINLAERSGFEVRSIAYAGFGVELSRMAILTKIDRMLGSAITRMDHRLHLLNNCTVIEFTLVG